MTSFIMFILTGNLCCLNSGKDTYNLKEILIFIQSSNSSEGGIASLSGLVTSVVLCNLDCQGQKITVILHFVYFEEFYSIFVLNSFPFHKPRLIILTISTNKDWLWLWCYGYCLFSFQISYPHASR